MTDSAIDNARSVGGSGRRGEGCSVSLEAVSYDNTSPIFKVSAIKYPCNVGKRHWLEEDDWGVEMKTAFTGRGRGTALNLEFWDLYEYADRRKDSPANTIFMAGRFNAEADDQPVMFKAENGPLAATKDHLAFREGLTVAHIDVDVKDRDEVAALYPEEPIRFQDHGAARDRLIELVPEIADCGMVISDSSSSCIEGPDGPLTGVRGLRVDIVMDGLDVERFIETVHVRDWVKGGGWAYISKGGSFLVRSVADMAMARPTQPDFLRPDLGEGLTQNRRFTVYDGGPLLHFAPLTATEERIYKTLVDEARTVLKPEEEATKRKRKKQKAKKLIKSGVPKKKAERAAEALFGGALVPDLMIDFGYLGEVSVRDLLTNGEDFDMQPCMDPVEPDYRGDEMMGMFFLNEGKDPGIYSFAHGGRWFSLRHDADSIDQVVLSADECGFEDLTLAMDMFHGTDAEKDAVVKKAANKLGVTKTALAKDLKKQQEGLAQMDLMDRVLVKVGAGNLIHNGGSFWQWRGRGVWERVEDSPVKSLVQSVTPREMVTRNTVDSVLSILKNEVVEEGDLFDRVRDDVVNCLNGQVCYDPEWGEWVLEPHAKDEYRTTQLPHPYDKAATAPRFERFLVEVYQGDEDPQSKALLTKEVIGYTLQSNCRMEKFVVLVGLGGNGKSVLLETLESLLGAHQVAGVQPSKFEHAFQRAHLENKLANIVNELSEGLEIADGPLKSIVSGETTTVERKYQHPHNVAPFATLWIGTNHLPSTRDFSHAFFRRALVIQFNRIFAEDEQDRRLKDKLKTELPGILKTCLDAYAGVLMRGHFTRVAEVERMVSNWRRDADQVARFVDERCHADPEAVTPVGDLYLEYELWAGGEGIKRKVTKRKFGDRLVALGFPRDRNMKARSHVGLVVEMDGGEEQIGF